jgi:dipeptidyl aminopeptidase/acylaminoacyl peptidase
VCGVGCGRRVAAVVALLLLAGGPPLTAQQTATARPALTADDYQRAERFMGYNTTPLVFRMSVRPVWLGDPGRRGAKPGDDRFWYRNTVPGGTEFVLVDPVGGTRTPAFDHTRLAAALSTAAASNYTALTLPFTEFELTADEKGIEFVAAKRRWRCEREGTACTALGAATDAPRPAGPGGPPRTHIPSPDGTRTAFVREHNLWVRDEASGRETQLTTDGEPEFAYARNDAGWVRSDTPVVVWSPDSKRIATFRHDSRGVGMMYFVNTVVGHPTLTAIKYPLPGDDKIFMIERVVIDVDARKVTKLDLPVDPHRSTLCDHIVCGGSWSDVEWSPDSREVAFVSTSRDHKREDMRIADAATGRVRNVLSERAETFFESGQGRVNWRYLQGSKEVLWFSKKDDWGHLYLHDATTGMQKNRITTGEGNVTQVLRVDEKARVIYFQGVGKETERDPYFRHFYKIDFDGRGQTLLTPDNGDHTTDLSPSGQYFVDTWSTPETPPVSVLRRTSDGSVVVGLETADISQLVATGWKPPMPFTVKARDGKTDLHGLMFRPTNFDPSRRYPIINNIYPGPQTGSVGGRSFSAARGDTQAIAELGFVVVQIDGMGTPWRSRTFHEAYYGDMGDNTLPDQVAGMKELASRYPWIDLERAGIYGHSGGGFATAGAMFRYPDFFKVGVSQAGNHDNRIYEDDWGEKWQGLLVRKPDGTTNYDDQANQTHAKNLKGKLLLAHGTMDTNVPVYGTYLVVDELIRANKDFDLIILPNRGHGFGNEPYMVRRRWDYFVRHLMSAEPPANYEMRGPQAKPAAPTAPQE